MNRRHPTQVKRAALLLEREGTEGVSDTAFHVFAKIQSQLAPLVGEAGVRALLVRSAQLTHAEFAFLDAAAVSSPSTLRACLQGETPRVAVEAAVALFGAFFTLIATYIGERLTNQALLAAFPAPIVPGPEETNT